MQPLEAWAGPFGDAYAERNVSAASRVLMWRRVCLSLHPAPRSILEVGANIGLNLDVLSEITDARLMGLEPNPKAREQIGHEAFGGTAQNIRLADGAVDLAFTCGVLIHVPPEELGAACDEIYRVSARHIGCIEYFAAEPERVPYRDGVGLWKRDFGEFWMGRHELRVLDCHFFWKKTTGLDNLTAWIFEKAL